MRFSPATLMGGGKIIQKYLNIHKRISSQPNPTGVKTWAIAFYPTPPFLFSLYSFPSTGPCSSDLWLLIGLRWFTMWWLNGSSFCRAHAVLGCSNLSYSPTHLIPTINSWDRSYYLHFTDKKNEAQRDLFFVSHTRWAENLTFELWSFAIKKPDITVPLGEKSW